MNEFSITKIELTHDQALELKQRVIDAIDKHGIENFERKTEIQVDELTKDDLIKVYVELETYTEWKEKEKPDPEEILSMSVMRCNIQLVNKEGDEVEYKILGEKVSGSRFVKTPIDIYEQIMEHFSINELIN